MDELHTTAAVQQYLDELAESRAIQCGAGRLALLGRAVRRLHLLCATLLSHSYRRLSRPPVNLQAEELLSAVVERLLKALRATRPQNVRGFFALANQHIALGAEYLPAA